ncbi:MAG: sugar nucleotide-binding protein, partial [Bacteroidales bacterium]|nr:sugar nucleotide-binding protein [Bacteroidales bacterium]
NALAPENLAKAMEEVGGLLVQISTDYVFGKEPYNVPCREDQKGTPSGVYGLTKLHGEERIVASGCKYVIIRTAWRYSEFGKNFCKTMLNLTSEESVAARVAAGKPAGLKVVFDQVGTPTYALDLARAIEVILADYGRQMQNGEGQRGAYSKTGVYHYSNEGVCSWYDFTKMIAEYSGQSGCDIQPCHSHEFPSPVKRPAYSVLDKTKIKEVFGVEVPYWTDSLRKCIANLKNV